MIFVEYVVFAVFFVTIGAIAGFFAKYLIDKSKYKKLRSRKAIEEWVKNGNVIIVEEENIEHNTSL